MGIFIGDTAPSKIFVGGSEVASVRAGDTKVRPTGPVIQTTTDVVVQTYSKTARSTAYNGVKFTALKNGTIRKVTFLVPYAVTGVLYICEGNNASSSGGISYNLTTSNTVNGEFTLDTPFSIESTKSYVVCSYTPNYQYAYYNGDPGFPITGQAVRYDYGTTGSNTYTSYVASIKSLTIDYSS